MICNIVHTPLHKFSFCKILAGHIILVRNNSSPQYVSITLSSRKIECLIIKQANRQGVLLYYSFGQMLASMLKQLNA